MAVDGVQWIHEIKIVGSVWAAVFLPLEVSFRRWRSQSDLDRSFHAVCTKFSMWQKKLRLLPSSLVQFRSFCVKWSLSFFFLADSRVTRCGLLPTLGWNQVSLEFVILIPISMKFQSPVSHFYLSFSCLSSYPHHVSMQKYIELQRWDCLVVY